MSLRYCPACQRMAATKRKFSWPAFVAWLVLLFGVGAIVYLVYYTFKPKDRCTACEAKTLTAPPPGYVLNPHAAALYVPQEVLHRQQQLHQGQSVFPQPPPRAEMLGASPLASSPPALQEGPVEAWSHVRRRDRTTCPGCGHAFAVEARRPLEVTCPACGTSGVLRGPAPAPAGGASR